MHIQVGERERKRERGLREKESWRHLCVHTNTDTRTNTGHECTELTVNMESGGHESPTAPAGMEGSLKQQSGGIRLWLSERERERTGLGSWGESLTPQPSPAVLWDLHDCTL